MFTCPFAACSVPIPVRALVIIFKQAHGTWEDYVCLPWKKPDPRLPSGHHKPLYCTIGAQFPLLVVTLCIYFLPCLQGKLALLSLTTGGTAEMYTKDGVSGDFRYFLWPLQVNMPSLLCWPTGQFLTLHPTYTYMHICLISLTLRIILTPNQIEKIITFYPYFIF